MYYNKIIIGSLTNIPVQEHYVLLIRTWNQFTFFLLIKERQHSLADSK